MAVVVNPWTWQAHPEVWVLVGAIALLGLWAGRIGPRVLPVGTPVASPFQKRAFVVAVVLLLATADWPVHDIAEKHLYAVHMLQHLAFTMIVPPLFLLATPAWLARLVILDGGRFSQVLRRMTHPVFAGILFNGLIAVTHWSGIVRWSAGSGTFHYLVHVALFGSALLMWMPVVSPLRELRLSAPGQMIYLFLMSIIPTIPAGWLTFADGVVYKVYDDGYEMWGIGVIADQQAAGAVMKVLGGFFLWSIIVVKFFHFAAEQLSERSVPRPADRSGRP
ncbi:MAG TPA: cytochrome c oxidase assembly protein [Acidimicrobiia bacterium]|jgi:putative membrane protein|nr:cytochrome c oxidase assembly protein [Acidimicrobiia bacterium]